MRSTVFTLLASFLIGSSFAYGQAVQVGNLRCEYLNDPMGVDAAQPRLSWIIESPQRGQGQTAYQVLVAASPAALESDRGDVWDSGKVVSDETAHVVYAGPALASRQVCYWKVRAWDRDGKPSDWSKPARWEMGLLKPGDWSAQWIEADLKKDAGAPAAGPVPILRKSLGLAGKPIASARLYATALGLYEIRINGRRVGDHVLAPDWTDYRKRVRYQVYDVAALLKQGENAMAALLGNGWYCGHIGNGGFRHYGKAPALLAQLEVTYTDGSVQRIVSDASWKVHASPILASDFMLGESYDATKEVPGWDSPGLDTASWPAATVRDPQADHGYMVPAPPLRLLEGQVMQGVRQTGELKPKSVCEPNSGQWIFDMGQNMVGVVRLKVSALAGTKLTLRHAEMLNPDGSLYTQNLRSAASIDTYICKGGGAEVWQPAFTFHGFRYVELIELPSPSGRGAGGEGGLLPAPTGREAGGALLPSPSGRGAGGEGPVEPDVTGIVLGTDLPRTGEFTCSDPRINQLQSNIWWGQRGNYLSIPTDCPQRDERLGWMGDAQVFVRTAAMNADVAPFFTKWLVDVDDGQSPDGGFSDVNPNTMGGRNVPAWADAGVICPWTIYQVYGDRRILERHLPAMTRWVEWCRKHSTNLIRDKDRGSDYGDWLSIGANTPKELIGTAYFAYSTDLVARSYKAIGNEAEAAKYERLFREIKAAFNQRYVKPDGHISGDTQCCYVMALKFDLLPDELRPKAAQYLEENIKAKDWHLSTGFVGVSYLLPVLTQAGKVDTAYKLLMQDTFPSWLFSVKQGATTIWERWDGWTPERGFQDPGMNSFNHYSLGSCGQWLFDSAAGIGLDAEKPGFRHIIIHPRVGGGLTSASASLRAMPGLIASSWTVKDGTFTLDLTLPANATATVYVPAAKATAVQESGKPATEAEGVKLLRVENGEAVFAVQSGVYRFTAR